MQAGRRNFLRSLPAAAALPLAGRYLLAQQHPGIAKPVCGDTCSVGGDPDPNVVQYHNANMAGPVQSALNGSITPDQLRQLAYNHIDNWNYSKSYGLDQSFKQALSNPVAGPDPATADQLASNFQSSGLAMSSSDVAAALSLNSSQAADAAAYGQSVGLDFVMSAAYNDLMYQAGLGGNHICAPYAQYASTLKYLAYFVGGASKFAPKESLGYVLFLVALGIGVLSVKASDYHIPC